MPSVVSPQQSSLKSVSGFAPAAALVAGFLALYAPIWADFAAGPWRRDENAHALIVSAIAAGAAASRLMSENFPLERTIDEQAVGLALVALGLALAFAGVVSEADVLSSASQGVVASGAAAALLGWRGVRRLWFPLVMTFYLVIWPGWALDALTSPLKTLVSEIVSGALYAAGLPVAHAGAVISAGPYQLLVADACSGLNSMIALTAVGAVYLYAAKRADWRVNAVVLASLVPIALAANIIRVAALVMITYYLGYDAGQGFLHDGAGLLMFAFALALVFIIDWGAALFFARRVRGTI